MSSENRIIEKDIERCAENTADTVVTTKTTGGKWKVTIVLICMILFGLSGLYYYQKDFELEKLEKAYQECKNDENEILNLYCDNIKNPRLTNYLKEKYDITAKIDTYLNDLSIFDAAFLEELALKLFILEKKNSVDSVNQEGYSLLILATRSNSQKIVKLLIDLGADLNITDLKYSATALHYACDMGHSEVVKILLIDTDKCDLNLQDNSGKTPLHVVTEKGQKEIVQILIGTGKCDLSLQDNSGKTPLHVATEKGQKEIVQILIGTGKCDLNITDLKYSATALHYACSMGHSEVVKNFIDTDKCDLNLQDKFGKTPLHVAAANGYKEIYKILITAGADETIKNNLEKTAQELLQDYKEKSKIPKNV